jgi:hypothetical protein
MMRTPPTAEEQERRTAALAAASPTVQSEKSGTHDTTAMRTFLVAALRCARCRALLLANEIDAVGVAVSRELVSLGAAYEWLTEIGAWPFLHPEIGEGGQ